MKEKIDNLRKGFIKKGLDGVLVSSASNITYLTGFSNFSPLEREAWVLIAENDQYIITDSRYSEAVSGQVQDFKVLERTIKNPHYKIIGELAKIHKIQRLGVEEGNLTFIEYKKIRKYFKTIKNFAVYLSRTIKTPIEISLIQKACEIGNGAFDDILDHIKAGISEIQISNLLEDFFKTNLAEKSFDPIVAFGSHASVPHHQTGQTKLEDPAGQFVMLDFGVKFQNYCSDMTRTIFYGQVSSEQKKIYQAVYDTQNRAVDFIDKMASQQKPIKASGVDNLASKYIRDHGYPPYSHALGHGIGLAVHEHPTLSSQSRDILQAGMVFSIEPGIYIPGFGGVRIEDLFVLEKHGLRQLTSSPKKLIITRKPCFLKAGFN